MSDEISDRDVVRQFLNLCRDETFNEIADDLDKNRERVLLESRLDEKWWKSLAKAAVTDTIPGGRFISDYAQAQSFDTIDERLEAVEARLNALEDMLSQAQDMTLNEKWWKSLAKATATKLPGGRFVSDYAQAQAFDTIDERLEAIEARLNELESSM